MKNLRIILPLTLLAATLLTFPIQPTKAYGNTEFAFAIDPPTGWTEKYDAILAPRALISFVNMDSRVIYRNITEICIYARSVHQSMSVSNCLGTYPDIIREDTESNDSAVSVESEGIRKVAGLDCYEVVFTMFGGDYANKYKEAIFIENGISYQILFFGQTIETYNDYLPAFEQSLQTFRLTGTPSVTPLPPQSIDKLLSLPRGSFYAIAFFAAIIIIIASVAVAVKRRLKRKTQAPSPLPPASGNFLYKHHSCQIRK